MSEVTIRDLRNHGGDVVERVSRGETVIVTRAGVPVAELRPIPRPRVTAEALILRWRHLSAVDPSSLRSDLDAVLDPSL